MPNPLDSGMPPDAPQSQPMQQQSMQQGQPSFGGVGQSPLATGAAPPSAQQQQQQQPAPTHEQTVAALRHFSAIQKELETLLRDPSLGKSSMKSSVIDGTTKLVADRIITPAQAVTQLGTFPDAPPDQKKWVLQHYLMTRIAETKVLDHHAQGNPGSLEWSQEAPRSVSDIGDRHMDVMSGVTGHYGGGRRA